MRPEKKKHKKKNPPGRGLGYKIFYVLAIIVIVAGWVYAFMSYFRHYDSMHPEITWAVPWVQSDTIVSEGVFLWNEQTLRAPRAGSVRYPKGAGPIRVQKGEVVARVLSGASGSSAHDVRAPLEGYFVAGLDGLEGAWRYASIWPGSGEFPTTPDVEIVKNGSSVKQGDRIGKLVPQPQELRFIGYADLSEGLNQKLAANRVMVKMDMLDSPSRAVVRVFDMVGHRVKLYLTMPWFPPEFVRSRGYRLIIEAGTTAGVAVPESAVTIRDGRMGTYVLKGSTSVFQEVQGRVIDGGKFLITGGIKLGDAVIVDADSAKEGRVKLW